MEFGIYTFVENSRELISGTFLSAQERVHNVLEEASLAEELGLDVFAVGEHHRSDFLISSPAVVLAAIAARTKNIRLSSAVTVLSSDDPVRVFQDFATVDLISNGRAEIMAGRGSFIESFPLFGYDLEDYDELFSEKLELLLQIRASEKISWKGKHRAPINNLGIYPRPVQNPIPVWIAVGGTPQSVVRAATLGLPLALAIIGGSPAQFAPLIKLYKNSFTKAGHGNNPQVGINTHVFIADDSQQAAETFYPSYADAMTRIGRERGWSGMTRDHYDAMRGPSGALMVGSPQQVIEKILYEYELFGNSRFLAQMSVGSVPHKSMLRSIELFGAVVVPAVRKAISNVTI